jgi:DNA-binding response OmpR family regulator
MNYIAPSKLRVFLVEDTVDLREEIIFGLNALGLDVSGFGDAAGLYRALAVSDCDIVVVDVGLPGESGFSIAEHLRGNPLLGIVFLTSHALLEDRLRGLGLGADAYLLKPIDLRELAATLHAVSRRLRAMPDVPPAAAWSLEQGGWVLRNPQGRELMVSDTERRFLEIMVASSGQVVWRETLVATFAAGDQDYDPHRLDAVISRLRKRTEQAGLGNLPLQSVRGAGYVFNA